MKISKKILILQLCLILFLLSFFKYMFKPYIIEVDLSGGKVGNAGPAIFVRGLKSLLPYKASGCIFIASESIFPINGKNKSDFFFLPFPYFLDESIYEKWTKINKTKNLLLGPCFVPGFWNNFPNDYNWKERRFREILKSVRGIIVHSTRVRNHLAQRSNSTDLYKKFLIVRPCTNLKPKYVKPFNNREIDIIFFEKYGDLNRSRQAIDLLKLFKRNNLVIKTLQYGNYTKEQMIELANNSKFIVYFSFFDTGAIGLKEFQNYGVFAFSHQKDLVINKDTSFFIPELLNEDSMIFAYNQIINIIHIISKSNPKAEIIAQINQKYNQCKNSLDDLCKGLIK